MIFDAIKSEKAKPNVEQTKNELMNICALSQSSRNEFSALVTHRADKIIGAGWSSRLRRLRVSEFIFIHINVVTN